MYIKYRNQVRELSQYLEAKREYFAELRNLEELETVVFSTTVPVSAAKVKTTPKHDRVGGKLDELSRLRKRCEKKSRLALEKMRRVFDIIDRVKTPILNEILTKRYIHGLRPEQIAVDLNYDYSHLTRLHNKAIEEAYGIK